MGICDGHAVQYTKSTLCKHPNSVQIYTPKTIDVVFVFSENFGGFSATLEEFSYQTIGAPMCN